MSNKTFNVLTIDGGGIKGLYSAAILRELEKYFETRIVEHFDLICGTSAGAIIACGLAVGLSADDISSFYFTSGAKIFRHTPIWSKTKQLFFKSKYKGKKLETELKSYLGEKKFKDSLCHLVIPTYDINAGNPYVFKTDHSSSLVRDSDTFLWEAALASASAPSYFPVYKSNYLKGHKFVDGGVWANNPSLAGLIETLRFFVGPDKEFDRFRLVSLSSISEHFAAIKVRAWHNSIVGWGSNLVNLFMNAQVISTERMVAFLIDANDRGEYLRTPSPQLSKEMVEKIRLDKAKTEILVHLDGLGVKQASNLKNESIIKDIFGAKKLSKT